MSDILRKQRERDRFLYPMSLLWQDEKDDGIAVRPEEYPENNPENTGPPIAVGPEDYPENDPSLEGTDPIELTDDVSPSKLPLIQQLQQAETLEQPASEPESQGGYAEGYEKDEDGMLRPKAKPQQYAGPVTPDGRMPEKVESPQPADPNVTAADIQKKQDDEETASVLAQEDGMSLSDVGLPEYSYIDETDGRDSWRNADLSPLPGEERLHEDVRKWADTDRTAGGTGMQRLRQQYLEEVPVKSRKLLGFNQWLEQEQNRVDLDKVELDEKGEQKLDKNGNTIGAVDIPAFDPEDDLGYRGNREALNRRAPMPGLNGAGVDSHRARLRKQKVIGSYLQRYGDESVLSSPMTREDAEGIYDKAYADALANGENPVLAAGRALHGYSQEFQQDKDAQLRQNVSNRASQMHRAQRFGVPVGLVAAVDQYRNAGDDPLKQQQALLMGAMQYPQVFLPIYQAQSYATNQASLIAGMNNGMAGGVPGQNPNMRGDVTVPEAGYDETKQGMQNALSFMTVHGFEPNAWIQAKTGAKWLDMTPEGQADFVGMKYSKQLDLIRKMIAQGATEAITPETKGMLRDMLGNPPDPALFNRVFGQLEEGEYENIVSVLYNQEPTTWRDVGEGVREGLGDLKDGVTGFWGGLWGG